MKEKILVALITATLVLTSVMVAAYAQNGVSGGAESSSPAVDGANGVVEAVPSAVYAEFRLPLFRTYKGHVGYVTAGIGVRNTGRGTISLTTPRGATLVDAWLYWMILDGTTPSPNNNRIVLNGIIVTGTLIGSGTSPCWVPPKGYTYRAKVNSVLALTEGKSGISYGLEVGGMNTVIVNGSSPWPTPAGQPLAESVHLVIVYSHPEISPSIVQIFDGYYMQCGGNATFVYGWPPRAGGSARFSHLTGDGQEMFVALPWRKAVVLKTPAGSTTIDTLALCGNDPSLTSKASFEGSLADTDTYNVGSLIPAVGTPSNITWVCQNDCISFAALIFGTGVELP